jgi:hypothetical protein
MKIHKVNVTTKQSVIIPPDRLPKPVNWSDLLETYNEYSVWNPDMVRSFLIRTLDPNFVNLITLDGFFDALREGAYGEGLALMASFLGNLSKISNASFAYVVKLLRNKVKEAVAGTSSGTDTSKIDSLNDLYKEMRDSFFDVAEQLRTILGSELEKVTARPPSPRGLTKRVKPTKTPEPKYEGPLFKFLISNVYKDLFVKYFGILYKAVGSVERRKYYRVDEAKRDALLLEYIKDRLPQYISEKITITKLPDPEKKEISGIVTKIREILSTIYEKIRAVKQVPYPVPSEMVPYERLFTSPDIFDLENTLNDLQRQVRAIENDIVAGRATPETAYGKIKSIVETIKKLDLSNKLGLSFDVTSVDQSSKAISEYIEELGKFLSEAILKVGDLVDIAQSEIVNQLSRNIDRIYRILDIYFSDQFNVVEAANKVSRIKEIVDESVNLVRSIRRTGAEKIDFSELDKDFASLKNQINNLEAKITEVIQSRKYAEESVVTTPSFGLEKIVPQYDISETRKVLLETVPSLEARTFIKNVYDTIIEVLRSDNPENLKLGRTAQDILSDFFKFLKEKGYVSADSSPINIYSIIHQIQSILQSPSLVGEQDFQRKNVEPGSNIGQLEQLKQQYVDAVRDIADSIATEIIGGEKYQLESLKTELSDSLYRATKDQFIAEQKITDSKEMRVALEDLRTFVNRAADDILVQVREQLEDHVRDLVREIRSGIHSVDPEEVADSLRAFGAFDLADQIWSPK